MLHTPDRTELQKKIGKIVRNTKIASWQKCEELEELFNSHIIKSANVEVENE